jgi:lysophospholipase L1-like esterase
VRLLTIWFGANDAAIPPSAQHVPLPKFVENLKKLIRMITSPQSPRYSPDTRIVLITPPPVNTFQLSAEWASRNPPLTLNRDFEVTREYAMAVRDVGFGEGVGVADVWTRLWENSGKDERRLEEYLRDGLHLNADGYQVPLSALVSFEIDKLILENLIQGCL